MKGVRAPSQWLFATCLTGLVVLLYLRLASVLPYGLPSQQAALAVEPPLLYRFLLPWTLGQILPVAWLDSLALRVVVTTLAVAACFALFPRFVARVLDVPRVSLDERRLWVGLAAVLVAHYGIPRPYCFWCIYDIPAIAFYMLAFLAMTRRQGQVAWWCVPMLALLSLNRETIVVAVLHAAAWHGWRNWRVWRSDTPLHACNALISICRIGAPLLASLMAVILVRACLVRWLGHEAASVALIHDGEQLRVVAGFARMASKPDHALALLLIGAGALVWLPLRWRRQTAELKVLMVASMPAITMFLAVGNVVELRMYSELVPVLAAMLRAPLSVKG